MEEPLAYRVVLVPGRWREPAMRLVERDEHDFRLHIGQPNHALACLWLLRLTPTPDSGEDLASTIAAMKGQRPLRFGQRMHTGEAYAIDQEVGQLGQLRAYVRLLGKAPQDGVWAKPVASCGEELVTEHQ